MILVRKSQFESSSVQSIYCTISHQVLKPTERHLQHTAKIKGIKNLTIQKLIKDKLPNTIFAPVNQNELQNKYTIFFD